jgi:hypothetical protein
MYMGLTIFLVHAPKLEMAVTLVGVVELIGIGYLGQKGAGVLGQRMEEDSVDDDGDGLEASPRISDSRDE